MKMLIIMVFGINDKFFKNIVDYSKRSGLFLATELTFSA